MSEADEIAANIAARLKAGTVPTDMDKARDTVRQFMPHDTSAVMIDNVAWSLTLCGKSLESPFKE
jgi:hypothetical protein